MNLESVMEIKEWVKNNLNIHNTQLPNEILDIIHDCTPEQLSDDFITFALITYSVKEGLLKSGTKEEVTKQIVADDKATLYISRLLFSFIVERLRRYKVISFEPVRIFYVDEIESRKINVIGKQDFIEDELRGKTVDYKDFVNVFW